MLTLTFRKKTKNNGHLVIDIPTNLMDKDVEVVMTIQEQNDTPTKKSSGENPEIKYDFSQLLGKLEWKGDALFEQKKLRSEWE